MAQGDRLQPSLLDRLTDDEPDKRQESRDRRVISIQGLREAVLRDLSWLLNTTDLGTTEDLSGFPMVGQSVLNYGMGPLSGRSVKGLDSKDIERRLRQTITSFEPRILSKSLKVRVVVSDDQMSRNAVSFDIEGELWSEPVPLRVLLKTEVDLETGNVSVEDQSGRVVR